MATSKYQMDFSTNMDIYARVGDTFDFQVNLTLDGVAVDLSLYNVLMQVRDSQDNIILDLQDGDFIKNAEGVQGDLVGVKSHTLTQNITPDEYVYDLQLELIATNVRKTWLYGYVIFAKDTSR